MPTETLGVRVQVAHVVPAQDGQSAPHRVAFAERRSELRHQRHLVVHLDSEPPRDRSRPIRGVVYDHDLVDQAQLAQANELF